MLRAPGYALKKYRVRRGKLAHDHTKTNIAGEISYLVAQLVMGVKLGR
jgi:hypothetical protein